MKGTDFTQLMGEPLHEGIVSPVQIHVAAENSNLQEGFLSGYSILLSNGHVMTVVFICILLNVKSIFP